MDNPQHGEVTELLIRWGEGDHQLIENLYPLVKTKLHRIAANCMRREAPNHILQTTALVNEAYLKLVDQTRTSWKDRAHFFAVAAKLMRHILVDEARRENCQKRGGMFIRVELEDNLAVEAPGGTNILGLDEALTKLAKRDERKSKIVELRCFVGLEVKEIAELLHISVETVMRDLRLAKAWLQRELERPVAR